MKFLTILFLLFPIQIVIAGGMVNFNDTFDKSTLTSEGIAEIRNHQQKIAQLFIKLESSHKEAKEAIHSVKQRLKDTPRAASCIALMKMKREIDVIKSEMQKLKNVNYQDEKDLLAQKEVNEKTLVEKEAIYEGFKKDLENSNNVCAKKY